MITLGPAMDIRELQRRNLCTNPGLNYPANPTYGVGWWVGSGTNAVTQAQVSAPWSKSGKAFRVTWTTRTASSGDIGINPGNMPDMQPKIIGRTVSVSMVLNASADFTSSTSLAIANVVGGSVTTISRNVATPKANTPTRFWAVFQIPATVTIIGGLRVGVYLPLTSGVWAEVSDVEVYEGVVDFNNLAPSNGATDGWKWDGAAWGSSSVGYPNTLERIIGKPAWSGVNVAPGAQIPNAGINWGGDLTFYHVFTDPAPAGQRGLLETRGGNGPRGFRMMWGNPSASNLNPGRLTPDGIVATSLSNANFTTNTDTKAYGISLPTGNMTMELIVAGNTSIYSGGSTITAPAVPVEAHVGQRDGIVATGLFTTYCAVFQANHSAAVKRAVVNWLANRYGLVA